MLLSLRTASAVPPILFRPTGRIRIWKVVRSYKSTLANSNPAASSSFFEPHQAPPSHQQQQQQQPQAEEADPQLSPHATAELRRLRHIRNVGVFAHVDAGKTTVTERMLALAGVVRQAGSVDDGNTVTDYLPAERERGITISSAAISFPWQFHNAGDDAEANDHVTIQLIDTPGHIDFSVEVNRSVAVLDGAVLVVDSVAGVQAQTETVWRAMTRPSLNNHMLSDKQQQHYAHEPLPCLALINKMDKEGCHFGNAIRSLKQKLPGANPIPIQMPLFRSSNSAAGAGPLAGIEAVPVGETSSSSNNRSSSGSSASVGDFAGVVDLLHMRAIVWPDGINPADVEACIPQTFSLLQAGTHEPLHPNCQVTEEALAARCELLEAMAECDEQIEECYLTEKEPSNAELRAALRRVTLSQRGIPVMASAALRGKGVEPVLDAIADLLPSPLDRRPPPLNCLDIAVANDKFDSNASDDLPATLLQDDKKQLLGKGHPLHPSLLALAFKVVHMKGRGGSGDGRVVFARVYSGVLRDRDVVQVISPPAPGEAPDKPRKERSTSHFESL